MVDSATLTLGTSPLIRLPKQATPTLLKPGQGYFRLRLQSAQAAIFGPFWQQAQQLVVTSEVRLFCPPFNGEPVQALQYLRPVKQGAAEQLDLLREQNLFEKSLSGRRDRNSSRVESLHPGGS